MAYERQYYTNGDVLDARQMNHMETGIKENSDNIDKLSEDIANLRDFHKIDVGELIEGEYIDANSGGSSNLFDIFHRTDFLYIHNYKTLIVRSASVYGGDGLAFYTKDKKYISGYADKTTRGQLINLAIPTNCYYVRSTAHINNDIELYLTNYNFEMDHREMENVIKKIQAIENMNNYISIKDVINGDIVELATVNSFRWSSISDTNEAEIKRVGSGSTWAYLLNPITPDFSHECILEFDAKLGNENTNNTCRFEIWLSNGRSDYVLDECIPVKSLDLSNEYERFKFVFDPAYYAIYKNPAWTQFNVWLVVHCSADTTSQMLLKNVSLRQHIDAVTYNNITGDTVEELFSSIDDKLTNNNVDTIGRYALISPDGTKYEMLVGNDGILSATPIVPNKAMFFGNSLLSGNGFGMAASDSEHDYYYLINNCISGLNSNYTSKKIGGTNFEECNNTSNVGSCVNSLINELDGDETLVVIQLGDNVNTSEKIAVFKESAIALCRSIRNKCPKARVVWMGMWYASKEKYDYIENACRQTGCKFISFTDLVGSEANNKIGGVQKLSKATRTVNNVTNVIKNNDTNITVSFMVSGTEYTTTIDVESWSMVDATLTYTSEYSFITNAGVASHPGDEGFRRIANKFLYEMGIVDVNEYYTIDMLNIK